MTVTTIDPQQHEAVDLGPDAACQCPHALTICEQPAAWLLLKGCGCRLLRCDPCRVAREAAVHVALAIGLRSCVCALCGVEYDLAARDWIAI